MLRAPFAYSAAMSPLKMMSSMASRDMLSELAVQFEMLHGRAVSLVAAGGVEVLKRLRAGENTDVVVLARNSIDTLSAEGLLCANSVADIAQSGIAAAVPESALLPDISSEAAVRRAVEQASSLSYSTGPSGVYLEKKFAAWGILDVLRARIVVPPPGTPVGALVADGKAGLGFQQLSELLGVKGIRLVGLLPPDMQLMTTFSGAVAKASDDQVASRQLLSYMTSASTVHLKRRFGMDA